MSDKKRYRLITRSDFDGLVCAVLLRSLDMIEDIMFVHPKDMQDGKIEIDENDITANLPHVPGAHLSFDHHMSEKARLAGTDKTNHIIDAEAPSAARVVHNYFGGEMNFPDISTEMMEAVDKADAAQFRLDEILSPSGWVLLNFIMDARTGLGRFHDFRISNYELMGELIHYCSELTIDEILELPDVKERVELYFEHQEKFKDQIGRCSSVHDDLIVLDLRDEEVIYAGNRFMIYALYPQCNISMHILWGRDKQNTVFAIGKSIIDRSSPVDVGALCLEYGGGGHRAAGTCQIDNDNVDAALAEIIEKINAQGE